VFRYIEVYTNDVHPIYIGVYPHKYIGHEDNVQTGGVVRVRYILFNAHLCNHIILLQSGGGTWDTVLYTVRGVRGLGIRMLTIDTKTSLYTEDRELQVPMALEHDRIVTASVPRLLRPAPRVS
jgi:hypothetical protein